MEKTVFFLLIFLFGISVKADVKNVIQKEKMSFEKCIEIVKISSDKLSITPVIQNENNNLQIAEFVMTDGKLLITCDKIKNELVVTVQ